MKSNLTKEDYEYLLYKAETIRPSFLSIKIGIMRGEIKCYKILISDGGRNINGKAIPSIYKYAFKLFLNNIDYKNIYDFVNNNQEILVDDIKYYLGNYTIENNGDNKITEITYISYYFYNEDNIKK